MRRLAAPAVPPLAHVPELDGLRGLAVLAVLGIHCMRNILPGGFIGVDVFFVLSGFLITRILLHEFDRSGGIGFIDFYARRCLRLMPALWLFLLVYTAVAAVEGGVTARDHLLAALSAGLYVMDWTKAFDLGPQGFLGHTWSLAVEEQFYLVWPLLLWLSLRRLRRASVWVPILLALAASTAWRGYLVHAGAGMERVYNGFDTRAETLLFGCLLAAVPAQRLAPAAIRYWYVPAGLLVACLFFLPAPHPANPAWLWKPVYTIGFTGVAACSAWVVLAIVQCREAVRIPVLGWTPIMYVGRISYGLYLWHYPVKVLVGRSVPQGLLNFAITVSISGLIAAASFHGLERRALRLKSRFAGRAGGETEALGPSASMAV